jgi:hypothetical protein
MRNAYVTVVTGNHVRDGVNGTVIIKYVLNETWRNIEELISSFRNRPEGLM